MKHKAFTLIELLIVIAIIAILALIAVPNFLEAQVRAKVSRVHADMRTLATGLEAYNVDFGRTPVDADEWQDIHGVTTSPNDRALQRVLTTPVAYIAQLTEDPFVEKGHVVVDNQATLEQRKTYRFRNFHQHVGESNAQASVRGRGFNWMTRSLGPARTAVNPDDPSKYVDETGLLNGNAAKMYIYDPTNGTISFGLIIRTNKGAVDGPMLHK